MRCDGERPVCRVCRVRPPRSLTPCKYSHAPLSGTASPQLEEVMQAMQNKIQALEHQIEILSGKDPSSVFLSSPYPEVQELDLLDAHTSDNAFATPSPIEDTLEQTGTLIENFLRHFSRSQFFFLNSSHFQQTTLSLPHLLPTGLLSAVALWGNRLFPNSVAVSTYTEEELLSRTVHQVAREIAAIDHAPPQRILYLIQTEVLLSLYYLDCVRLFECNYHCAGATSLALTSGLHRLVASTQPLEPPSTLSAGVSIRVQMGTAWAMEMIDAFWSVVILNNYCVAASETPSSIPCDTPVVTPWPTHMPFTPPIASGNDLVGHSPLTLLARASVQLERVMAFTGRTSNVPQPQEFWSLDSRLETFRGNLPPIGINTRTEPISLTTHALLNFAIIKLHGPHQTTTPVSQTKCLTAASCLALRLTDAHLAEWQMADPILGPLLASVAQFLIDNLAQYYSPQSSADLHTIMSAMQTLARWSRLIHHHLTITQQRYDTASAQQLSLLHGVSVQHS
ncbi:transcriptional activator protein acu-15 [Favolaschia claudopus]|uniref:Transcriptional activator protein acu-15 n=1 Tax=Favolaschia claudopus TaxID=2862362 RepID=A0AAW0DZ78_9AGAR